MYVSENAIIIDVYIENLTHTSYIKSYLILSGILFYFYDNTYHFTIR